MVMWSFRVDATFSICEHTRSHRTYHQGTSGAGGDVETFGKHYRVSEKKTGESKSAIHPPDPLRPGEKAPGFQQQNTLANDEHNTDSYKKFDLYYTAELMETVKRVYWMDFALYDAVLDAGKEGKVHGKDIANKLNKECTLV